MLGRHKLEKRYAPFGRHDAGESGLNSSPRPRRNTKDMQPSQPSRQAQRKATLSVGSWLCRYYRCYWSRPASARVLYRLLYRRTIRAILQLGIPTPALTRQLLSVAAQQVRPATLAYTGVDLFEARPEGLPKLSLKDAFATLRQDHVRVQLVPGDPDAALARVANFLGPIDLVLVTADQEPAALARAWRWLPRLMGREAVVMVEERPAPHKSIWRALPADELQSLVAAASQRRRRAA